MKLFPTHLIIFISCCFLSNQAVAMSVNMGDLFVIDSRSGILRVTKTKDISVFLSTDQIESVIGIGNSSLGDNGIAFDALGNMYFVDDDQILKYTQATSSLSVLTSELAMSTAQGLAAGSSDPDALSISASGIIYVTDDRTESILAVDSNTGNVTVLASEADFLAQTGIDVNIEQGVAIGENGNIYVASQGSTSATAEVEDAIFEITPTGTISVLVSNDQIADPDQFMTIDPYGNLVVASDEGDTEKIFQIDIVNGDVSELISTAILESLLSDIPPDVDVRGGLAYDYLGNLYVGDSDEDLILFFDTSLNGSVFIDESDIIAVTGESSASLSAGFAFSPNIASVPAPAIVYLLGTGLMALLGWRKKYVVKYLSVKILA